MIFYDEPFLKITWNEQAQCVDAEWRSFAFGEPYREGMNKALELHRLKGCPRGLSDMRKGSVIVEEDTAWINGDWMPRARTSGVRRIAVIAPVSAAAQIQLAQMSRKGSQRNTTRQWLSMEFFKDLDAARRWLMASDARPVQR